MIDCAALRDRMPDAAHGVLPMSNAEEAHIESCSECAREWGLVQTAHKLHADLVVDTDRVASAVLSRLRTEPVATETVRRIPWRGGLIGLIAAAASVVVMLSPPRRPLRDVPVAEPEVAIVLPELQALDDSELETVLRSMGPTAADATPGNLPHLEDLTDAELEQLLGSKGAE